MAVKPRTDLLSYTAFSSVCLYQRLLLCTQIPLWQSYKFRKTNKIKGNWLCDVIHNFFFQRDLYFQNVIRHNGKGKGQVRPRAEYEGLDGEDMYSSTLSLTSGLDGVGCYPTPWLLYSRERNPVPTEQEARYNAAWINVILYEPIREILKFARCYVTLKCSTSLCSNLLHGMSLGVERPDIWYTELPHKYTHYIRVSITHIPNFI